MATSFTYTAPYSEAHISADLSAMALLFIEFMCQQQEQNKSYGELAQTKDALAQFGFKNSQNAKLLDGMTAQMADYRKATDTLAYMEDVWAKFGTDAMVVRYDHFFQILEKYDMVCGSFDRYTGGIPQEALDTLTRLNGMWERKELESKYALGLSYTKRYTVTDEEEDMDILRKRLRMPMRTDNKAVCKEISNLTRVDISTDEEENRENLTDVLFIAAPAADMKPLEMNVRFETERLKDLRSAKQIDRPRWSSFYLGFSRLSPSEQAIREATIDKLEEEYKAKVNAIDVKVKEEEKRLQDIIAASDISRYAKLSFVHKEPEIVRILKDPFICSLTPYGVLIHAKWGEEAEDATIKRYEQLRDAIIGKGGAI